MSKILILSASTGAGHNQAANNLKKEFVKGSHTVEIVDIFASTSKIMNELITEGYDILATKMPETYGKLYYTLDVKEFNKYILKRAFFIIEYRVRKMVHEIKPDLIMSTHPFGVPIVGALKSKGLIWQPFVQVVTDFKAHYAYVDDFVDAYITASDFTKDSLIERGVPAEKIYSYGIPIKEEFRTEKTKERSTDDIFRILVMGGSMGLKSMEESVRILINSDLPLEITVVCARNKSLYGKLINKFYDEISTERLKVLGFVNNIHELMEKSDLIVTKPGGLTTSESINKSIPMIIPFAIPGQEQDNTSFMVDNNMAIEVRDIELLPVYVRDLIEHPEKYQMMVDNMKKLSATYSVEKIVELVESIIEKS